MPLPTFDAAASCPKCGGAEVSAAYRRQGDYCLCFVKPMVAVADPFGGFTTNAEHLERRCTRCHYVWAEAPIDAAIPVGEIIGKETP